MKTTLFMILQSTGRQAAGCVFLVDQEDPLLPGGLLSECGEGAGPSWFNSTPRQAPVVDAREPYSAGLRAQSSHTQTPPCPGEYCLDDERQFSLLTAWSGRDRPGVFPRVLGCRWHAAPHMPHWFMD